MKRNRIIYLLALFVFASAHSYGQKENYNWLFGYGCGLTWNVPQPWNAPAVALNGFTSDAGSLTGIPTPIPSSIQTLEGCFALSDVDGNLLFYSDGITIWNRENRPMLGANGTLTGHWSSVQSGIIIPYPDRDNYYIAVSIDYEDKGHLTYTLIDLTLDGGLGGVVDGYLNVPLQGASGSLGEVVTAVWNANANDVWIIAVGRGPVTYLNVWKVTSGGVNVQRHSVASINMASTAPYATGYLAFSESGDRFAWANALDNYFMFGRFNNTTGTFSSINSKAMDGSLDDFGFPYGAAFSKSGDYLYITRAPDYMGDYASGLYSYRFTDLESNPSTASSLKTLLINKSAVPGDNGHFGALMMGPDNRMYSPLPGSRNMYVMDNLETPASLQINVLQNILPDTATAGSGLSSFMAPWFRMSVHTPEKTEICADKDGSYTFSLSGGYKFDDVHTITIDWGDGESFDLVQPTPASYSYTHQYPKRGSYTLTATPFYDAGKTQPITERIYTETIKVNSCALPVNHNTSVLE